MVKILIKLFFFFNSIIILLLSIGFSFDTGSDLEIAGKIIFAVIAWLLFAYFLWRKELKDYTADRKPKQVFYDILKFFIAVIVAGAIIGIILGFISLS